MKILPSLSYLDGACFYSYVAFEEGNERWEALAAVENVEAVRVILDQAIYVGERLVEFYSASCAGLEATLVVYCKEVIGLGNYSDDNSGSPSFHFAELQLIA